MPFVPFDRFCPEVAKQETRTITVPAGSALGVPAADYVFLEMFCDEAGCDCRRVMFNVLSSARKDVEAVIAWGWEDLAFYHRWLGMNDPEMLKELRGPILNLGSPQTRYSQTVLRMAKEFLLTDPVYVERIKRHYALFREQIDGKEAGKPQALEQIDPKEAGQTRSWGRAAWKQQNARAASESARARRRREWRRGSGGGV